MSNECYWKALFSDQERESLQYGFILTGIAAVLLGSWINIILFSSDLRKDLSYRNLSYFTLAACIRRAVDVLSYFSISKYFNNRLGLHVTEISCDLFPFLDTFLGALEVECLTHICIERYVVAKYITKGWQIRRDHYVLYPSLCVLFAALYSFPPLLGLGRFGHDFSCTSCNFDMVVPDTWQRYVVVVIFLLRSVKPAGFMAVMLYWCYQLENKYSDAVNVHIEQKAFTKTANTVTLVNLLCWTPIVLIRAMVVFSQLLWSAEIYSPSATYITWSMLLHWISPAITAIALFSVDEGIRSMKSTNENKKKT